MFLTLMPTAIDLIAALNRDYLRPFGARSIQLFALRNSNVLELKATVGDAREIVPEETGELCLADLEKFTQTENIYRILSQEGCFCNPSKSLAVAPIVIGPSLKGFFWVDWDYQDLTPADVRHILTLYSSLSSIYLTQQGAFGEQVLNSVSPSSGGPLTPRQAQVLRGMVEGKTNHELASDLGFSVSTIRHETMAIFRALGVSDRKEAAKVAQQGCLL
jgi:DNA-binding CsgD family transcriptional regulator